MTLCAGEGWSSPRGYCVGGSLIGRGGLGAAGGEPTGGAPGILGALDRSLIDVVIKRNMSKVRDCYQRELVRSRALSGNITVKFVIARGGAVSSAETKSTTMNNPAVEQRINAEFLEFQFPELKGRGFVIVWYPLISQPG